MLDNDPLWYKDAIIYELPVRAFHDSIGDGMGDLRGLTQKLDYLQDLGVTAIWLLPFYPSPLKDDGYDIAHYTSIHPHYGTLQDFEELLRGAHARGLRIITELVLNHTSDQHPWFQRARHAPPGSPERDFYVWSESPDRYREARIIFQDFEPSNWTWDPVAKAYYWHRFYSHQPDLNFDNPAVWDAMFPVVDFWLGLGVDGMRLDAVPYLYEREGTICENLPETHAFLKALRKHVDAKFPNRMLLAEANQWPEDAAAYFGAGDECHVAFHFPLMPRMFMAIHMEDRFPILDILDQTPVLPPNCQWSIFLRNHDELTLEMVTDEERDYMYRAYAVDPRARINLGIRRRLAPLLGSNRRKMELMNSLLLSLPGTPVVYYGDEIGMGDNIYLGDRNSVRTPMQWSADRNAGFSRANPQKLFLPVIIDPEYHYEAINVEAQQNNPSSLLWWTKRLIALRKRYQAFSRGSLTFLHPANRKVLAFLRRYENDCLLVVANLSRFAQFAELNLAEFAGHVPAELFGRTLFPALSRQPFTLSLGPHGFYWFALEPQPAGSVTLADERAGTGLPVVTISAGWESVFATTARQQLEALLPDYLRQQRWFGGKARVIRAAAIHEAIRIPVREGHAYLTFIRVEFTEGTPETYVLPLTFTERAQASRVFEEMPQAVVAGVRGNEEGVLWDAFFDPLFCTRLLEAIVEGRHFEAERGELVSAPVAGWTGLKNPPGDLTPRLGRHEQSNSTVTFGDQLVLKLLRRIEDGTNPDLEIGRYLATKKQFTRCASILGAIEYCRRKAEPATLAVLYDFVANQGDAWQYTLDDLSGYFERVLALRPEELALPPERASLVALSSLPIPPLMQDLIDTYLQFAERLGQRTAEMHQALTADTDDPHFRPQPFTTFYQRSIYQTMRSLRGRVFEQLSQHLNDLPEEVRPEAQQVLEHGRTILERFQSVLHRKITGLRIRCHGDYHLGQVLNTGKDIVVIDFEGEPMRSLSARRIKRSPLRDVAGMIRSFHYASHTALFGQGTPRSQPIGVIRPEDRSVLEPWARHWYNWVSAAFLRSYLAVASQAKFLPDSREELEVLLNAFLLEKAIYELGYELNSRPDWVRIPILGILHLLNTQS